MRGPAVVALGGGHGLAASLTALRRIAERLTAVVTVADDGGSSGRLRSELGALPPGDLRMALVALAADSLEARLWAAALQHRFGGTGPLAEHAVGNLLLTGLAESVGSPVTALALVGRLLGLPAGMRVLPASVRPLDIEADVVGLDPADPNLPLLVRGQVAVATTGGRVIDVRLRPPAPAACAQAVEAIQAADWIVLGPGSLFTSVVPHLLVPALRAAVTGSAARRLLVLNLAPQPGETDGFSPQAHVDALAALVPELRLDLVLADRQALPHAGPLAAAANALGAHLKIAEVAHPAEPAKHDPVRLARAFSGLLRLSPHRPPERRPAVAPGRPGGEDDPTPVGVLTGSAGSQQGAPLDRTHTTDGTAAHGGHDGGGQGRTRPADGGQAVLP